MTELLTDPAACEALLADHRRSILDDFGYKKILNDRFAPDRFLFFRRGETLLPLVVKGDLATFYGGTRFNHANTLPEDPELLRFALEHLRREGLRFRLLSVVNDVFALLPKPMRRYDVPYPPEWHYDLRKGFRAEAFVDALSGRSRRTFRRILNHRDEYRFQTLPFDAFETIFDEAFEKHLAYFRSRGLRSAWEGNADLLRKICRHFHRHENLFIRTIRRENDLKCLYLLVYDEREMIAYLGGSLDGKERFVTGLFYFDMLENAARIAQKSAIRTLNALRGSFTYKRRFGFAPKPLYALVDDPAWTVRRDPDVTPEEYDALYGRAFGAEIHAP